MCGKWGISLNSLLLKQTVHYITRTFYFLLVHSQHVFDHHTQHGCRMYLKINHIYMCYVWSTFK